MPPLQGFGVGAAGGGRSGEGESGAGLRARSAVCWVVWSQEPLGATRTLRTSGASIPASGGGRGLALVPAHFAEDPAETRATAGLPIPPTPPQTARSGRRGRGVGRSAATPRPAPRRRRGTASRSGRGARARPPSAGRSAQGSLPSVPRAPHPAGSRGLGTRKRGKTVPGAGGRSWGPGAGAGGGWWKCAPV